MIMVTLSYPNGQRQEVLLAGVPRVGEHVRPHNGPTGVMYVAKHVLWLEGDARREPDVVVEIEPWAEGPTS